MKYVVILGDGMADEPAEELGNKTPLEYGSTPYMDFLAERSEIGLVRTVPEGMSPGSDTANLAVLGYDPRKYYTGRSSLEALSIGAELKETDIAVRCNLVTLEGGDLPYERLRITDHSAEEISTDEADELLRCLKRELENENFRFFTGTGYRHLMIWDHGTAAELVPPHDILGKQIGDYLPKEPELLAIMKKSYGLLERHPLNLERERRGLRKANSLWFWGPGTKPFLPSFQEKNGCSGAMISAVDLLKGIAAGAGMEVLKVPGATGGLHTNYEGKAKAALQALLEGGRDLAYIHLEAPDEMGHQGSAEGKVQAIEWIDSRVLGPVYEGLKKSGEEFRLLLLPDHPTPVRLRTHTGDPVPYLLYDSRKDWSNPLKYTEADAALSGLCVKEGFRLLDRLLEKEN